MELDIEKLTAMARGAAPEIPKESFAVAVAGSTGAGKSTLLNAMFGQNLAKTGIGSPQTQRAEWWPKNPDASLRILDTKGLEEKDYENTIAALLEAIEEANASEDARTHLHIVWLVIKESSGRVQDSHKDVVRYLTSDDQRIRVPVIAVLTQATNPNDEFSSEVRRQLPDVKAVVRVNSVPESTIGGGSVPVHGLDDLFETTVNLLPEAKRSAGARNAFIREAKICAALKEKKRLSINTVHIASSAAAAVGATPIPFADAAILAPIQAGMIAKISHNYGINVDENALIRMISTVTSSIAATAIGRAIVGGILKFVPGAGTLVGGVIAAGTAAAVTEALGHAYVKFLHKLCSENDGDPPSIKKIEEGFSDFYKKHGGALDSILKML